MKNVLIVDDERAFLSILTEGMKGQEEFTILTAENGRQALEVLQKEKVDLILTDIKMPQMDGFELLQYLNNDYPEVPVILMTAFGTREMEERSRSMGARQYLEKPFDIDTLLDKIKGELSQELKRGPEEGGSGGGSGPVRVLSLEPPPGLGPQFKQLFSDMRFQLTVAERPEKLAEALGRIRFDVAVLPVAQEQETSAFWHGLGQLMARKRFLPVILIGDQPGCDGLLRALRLGVCDYLDYREAGAALAPTIDRAVARTQDLKVSLRSQIRISQESEVQRLQQEMAYELNRVFSMQEEFESNRYQMVKVLVNALQIADPYESGHSERVAIKAKRIAQSMNQAYLMSRGLFDLKELEMAALLHDIGKLGVPKHILNYKGALSEDEWKIVRRHSEMGAEIVAKIDNLRGITPDIKYHHERWDGSGYPEGLRGENIPLKARILSLADAFDAMVSPRVYRQALGLPDVVREIKDNSGRQFDPEVVSGLLMSIGEE